MKERPILFSAPMVCALLDGSKTQTRRAMTPQPKVLKNGTWYAPYAADPTYWVYLLGDHQHGWARCIYGQRGEHLWVREAWQSDVRNAMLKPRDIAPTEPIFYAAGGSERATGLSICASGWRPSIHMPRTASRINLSVTDVRVQRLQDISEEDAKAEGVSWQNGEQDECIRKWGYPQTAKARFADLWCSINGATSWDANPTVWAISFSVESPA